MGAANASEGGAGLCGLFYNVLGKVYGTYSLVAGDVGTHIDWFGGVAVVVMVLAVYAGVEAGRGGLEVEIMGFGIDEKWITCQ